MTEKLSTQMFARFAESGENTMYAPTIAIYFKIQTLWKYLINKNSQIEVP